MRLDLTAHIIPDTLWHFSKVTGLSLLGDVGHLEGACLGDAGSLSNEVCVIDVILPGILKPCTRSLSQDTTTTHHKTSDRSITPINHPRQFRLHASR
jgi:hypothetical protein